MTIFNAPGIYVTESLSSVTPPPPTSVSPSVAAFAGEHWQGPGFAVLCTSWQQFVKYFGGFNPNLTANGYSFTNPATQPNPYLPYAVYMFFANGGQNAWVYRIVNSSSPGASASVNLLDQQATPQTSVTLQVGFGGVAGNPGIWANGSVNVGLSVQVIADLFVSTNFSLNVYYGGTLVEQWSQLSMLPTAPRYFLTMLNSITSGSSWVVANNNITTATVPPIPGTYYFSGGVDPSTPPSLQDRANAVTVGTSPFDNVPGVLNINLPGESSASVISAAVAYVTPTATPGTWRPDSFLVIDPAQSQTPSQIISTYGGSQSLNSGSAAVYYPWVYANDPSSSNQQATVALPAGGFVLGQYASVDSVSGVWVAPAGASTDLNNVVAPVAVLNPTQIGNLNNNYINALRAYPNGKTVIWGTRTQQSTYSTKYVPVRRFLNFIEASLNSLLSPYIFQPNDQFLWDQIINTCNAFLGGLLAQNAFPGTTAATSYYVICDTTNNTPQSIENGITNVTVGVALASPAEFIQINISQFQATGTTTLTVTT